MYIKYELGGFLNRTVVPQEILDGVTVLFDKLSSIGNLTKGEFYIDCDEESAAITYYGDRTHFNDPMDIYVSKYKARVRISSGGHEISIEDSSDMFISKWRKKMNEIRKTNLHRSTAADVATVMPVIAEFIKTLTDYLDSEEFKKKYG